MIRSTQYRPYDGPIRPRRRSTWWPITRTEYSVRIFRWRYLPIYLIMLTPLLFREAILYARFVVAPVEVGVSNRLANSGVARFVQFDKLDFYAAYLDDRFLWIFLLLASAVLGVPMIARDLGTRAWEIYFSRGIGRRDYFIGKFVAIFLFLFSLTWGGVVILYLTSSLLGPDPDFFGEHIGWLVPLTAHSALLSGLLALMALAFGTLSENGIILAVTWLALFFGALAAAQVGLRIQGDAHWLAWLDPRLVFEKASIVIHDQPRTPDFPTWAPFAVLGALAAAAIGVLARFLRQREEGLA